MASLDKFTQSPAAEEGAWVSPDDAQPEVQVRSRGYTDPYNDASRTALAATAKAYQNDHNRIPQAIARKQTAKALLDHVTMDIRGLDHPRAPGEADDAPLRPVTHADLYELVKVPQYKPLLNLLFDAANMVHAMRADEVGEAGPKSVAH